MEAIKDIKKDMLEIKHVIEKAEKVKLASSILNGTYYLYDKCEGKTNLYIRNTMNKRLTIARVYFVNQRIGTFSKVLELLKRYCDKYNIPEIVIESALTPEINAFCQKNGFKQCSKNEFDFHDGKYCGDYSLKLK